MRARVSIRGGLAPRSTRAIADCVVPQSSASSRWDTPQALRRSATCSAIRPNSSRSSGSTAPRTASRRDARRSSRRPEDLGPRFAIARLRCIAGLLWAVLRSHPLRRRSRAHGPLNLRLLPVIALAFNLTSLSPTWTIAGSDPLWTASMSRISATRFESQRAPASALGSKVASSSPSPVGRPRGSRATLSSVHPAAPPPPLQVRTRSVRPSGEVTRLVFGGSSPPNSPGRMRTTPPPMRKTVVIVMTAVTMATPPRNPWRFALRLPGSAPSICCQRLAKPTGMRDAGELGKAASIEAHDLPLPGSRRRSDDQVVGTARGTYSPNMRQ
jgi:hypothetical protein